MRWSPARDSTMIPIASPCLAVTAPERFCPCSRSGTWPKPSSISWSRPLAAEWERYLRQQIELGGAEIVLSEAAGQASPIPRSTRDNSRVLVAEPTVRAPDRLTGWRKGAPSIPGPGLAIESPSHVLGDELTALETLDAVAHRIRTTYCCALCPARLNAVPG